MKQNGYTKNNTEIEVLNERGRTIAMRGYS